MKKIQILKLFIFILLFSFARIVSAAVFINEIAWMGTSDSTSNEWIELANDGSATADITGWVLSIEGKKDIALSGSISTGGFYLIERTDDTTVPTIPADLIASFGTGISNTGAALSLKNASGAVVDRVDGSQEWNIGGTVSGNNTTKETAQRGSSGWFTGTPTPRATNIGATSAPAQESSTNTTQTNTNSITASFPVEPQIFADAGASVRTVSSGAPVTFTGRAFGLKKEPIENARMVWSFGDGGNAEGQSVSHIYYYPGEYVVVLDASSGFYSASARVRVTVSVPQLMLRTGGDHTHSFVSIENQGDNEIDLSAWKIHTQDKDFIFPQNTVLGARKIISFPSEVTGLVTPLGTSVSLHFPNGTLVPLHHENTPPHTGEISLKVPSEKMISKQSFPVLPRINNPQVLGQIASVIEALPDPSFKSNTISSIKKEGRLWLWYLGVGALGALAFVGVRFSRIWAKTDIADEYEIIEEKEKEESAHEVTRARDTLPF